MFVEVHYKARGNYKGFEVNGKRHNIAAMFFYKSPNESYSDLDIPKNFYMDGVTWEQTAIFESECKVEEFYDTIIKRRRNCDVFEKYSPHCFAIQIFFPKE